MSLVKRGYGYGGYGYGHSKPQINYHRQNSDSVTTVVTVISRMTVNEKPCYGAGAVQKQAFLEEVCEDDDGVYSDHRGGAVQKHDYRQEMYHHGDAAAVEKHDYGQEVYHHGGAAAVQKHGYGQEMYHGGDGEYAGHLGGAAQTHGCEQKVYQLGANVGAYALHHDSAVQKHGYGHHDSVVQKHGYGHHGGAAQKHGYGQNVYQHGGNVIGYDALVHDSAVQKYGYGKKGYQHGTEVGVGYPLQHGGMTGGVHRNQAQTAYGKAYKHEFAGGHHGSGLTHKYKEYGSEDESDCSEESGDESDCKEFAHGRHHDGGVHRYEAYKRDGEARRQQQARRHAPLHSV